MQHSSVATQWLLLQVVLLSTANPTPCLVGFTMLEEFPQFFTIILESLSMDLADLPLVSHQGPSMLPLFSNYLK